MKSLLKPFSIAFLLVIVISGIKGQETEKAAAPNETDSTENYFRFNYDNDFFSATDRYYTQGVYLELILKPFRKSPLAKILINLNSANHVYNGISFRQDCFTPRSIRHDSIYYGERPYAGLFYFSEFKVSLNPIKKQRITSSIDIGIIGPNAKTGETQKTIHRWLNNIQPLGWQYQISSDYVLNYSAKIEKGIITKPYYELIGTLGARAGTLYDDASAGVLLRTGIMPSYFEHLGLLNSLKRYSSYRKKQFQCYVYGRAELKTVLYNATLEGGLTNRNNVYVLAPNDIKRVVATGTTGIVLAYKRLSVEYTKVYITPEFKGGLSHGWGHCVITYCF